MQHGCVCSMHAHAYQDTCLQTSSVPAFPACRPVAAINTELNASSTVALVPHGHKEAPLFFLPAYLQVLGHSIAIDCRARLLLHTALWHVYICVGSSA